MEFNPGCYKWWEYFIMPFTSGVVGWFTNVLALEMTFRPIEFFGLELFRIKDQPWGLFGWQGIIPTKAEKMATICFELMTTKLLDVHEIFNRLQPDKFSEVMEDGLLLLMDSIINEVADEYMPNVWRKLPQDVKNEVVVMADNASGEFLSAFMADMQENIDDVLDIKEMTVRACVNNKPLVNKIFQECGDKEFAFIRISGLYFGFLFGCFQMALWFFYNGSWILPVFGFLVGWATNYVALKIIFWPLEPRKIGCFTMQGLFMKRQKEVSETFARVNCVEILHTRAIWDTILTGPLHKNFFAMLRAHSIVFTENMVGGLKPIAIAALGAQKFAMMKEDIAAKIAVKLPTIIDQSYEYMTEALDMERTIREKMSALSPADFEGVLHPAFEEDETTLIFVGGVLGCIVGVIQLYALFGTSEGCPV